MHNKKYFKQQSICDAIFNFNLQPNYERQSQHFSNMK